MDFPYGPYAFHLEVTSPIPISLSRSWWLQPSLCYLMQAERDFQVCVTDLFKLEVEKANSCSGDGLHCWET